MSFLHKYTSGYTWRVLPQQDSAVLYITPHDSDSLEVTIELTVEDMECLVVALMRTLAHISTQKEGNR